MAEQGGSNTVLVGIQFDGRCSGFEDMGEKLRSSDTMTVDRQTNEISLEYSEQLLPGIPNEITLAQISPKLPWSAFHILSSVSRRWQEAIQTHQVYNARVRANSTEIFVVHIHSLGKTKRALALYSIRDKRCHELPPIPHLDNQIPWSCRCVALDGKLYVLGGEIPFCDIGAAEVSVLDVAGQRNWRMYASRLEARRQFGCGTADGKIFVFGGTSDNKPVCGSEVYDPEENAWVPIMPMPSWRFGHKVAPVGNELFVYGGRFYDRFFERDLNGPHEDALPDHVHDAMFLDVYNPARNEWRSLQPFGRRDTTRTALFMAKGKLHCMTQSSIDVYDGDKDLWTNRHTNSFVSVAPMRSAVVLLRGALNVNDDFRYSNLCQVI